MFSQAGFLLFLKIRFDCLTTQRNGDRFWLRNDGVATLAVSGSSLPCEADAGRGLGAGAGAGRDRLKSFADDSDNGSSEWRQLPSK